MPDPSGPTPLDLPYFPFYPRDFLLSQRVRAMSLEAKGAYIVLLCEQWVDGPLALESLPARLGVTEARFADLWAELVFCFDDVDRRVFSPRLEAERADYREYRNRQSAAGKAGANARWKGRGKGRHSGKNATAKRSDGASIIAIPDHANGVAMRSNGLHSTTQHSTSPQTETHAREEHAPPALDFSPGPASPEPAAQADPVEALAAADLAEVRRFRPAVLPGTVLGTEVLEAALVTSGLGGWLPAFLRELETEELERTLPTGDAYLPRSAAGWASLARRVQALGESEARHALERFQATPTWRSFTGALDGADAQRRRALPENSIDWDAVFGPGRSADA